MAIGLGEFAKRLAATSLGEFESRPFYEPKSDSLIWYLRDTRSHNKRITQYLTFFLSVEDDSLVGFEVKSVKTIMKAIEDLGEVDLAKPVEVNIDGAQMSMQVIVRCALVTGHETPFSGEDWEQLEAVTKDLMVPRSLPST
ncbi:MAG: hypothetical protein JXB62_08965 [Pirellulales bacterium]|nr:hypothetical protein [Pirellulales bacterium]